MSAWVTPLAQVPQDLEQPGLMENDPAGDGMGAALRSLPTRPILGFCDSGILLALPTALLPSPTAGKCHISWPRFWQPDTPCTASSANSRDALSSEGQEPPSIALHQELHRALCLASLGEGESCLIIREPGCPRADRSKLRGHRETLQDMDTPQGTASSPLLGRTLQKAGQSAEPASLYPQTQALGRSSCR